MTDRIITLTLNPAVDLASVATTIAPTRKIRTRDERLDPGGGGINVARVIHALGGDTLALILVGGVTGSLIQDLLRQADVPFQALKMAGLTRISLNVREAATGQEYRFVPEGPQVTEVEWQAVLTMLESVEGGWLVASGSLPRGVPVDLYARIGDLASRRGMRFVLDSSGPALQAALGHGIALMKPSLGELEDIVGRKLPDRADQTREAVALAQTGAAERIAVTLGAEGAILASAAGAIHMPAIAGPVVTAVGAGDAFLGAMVLALSRGEPERDALAWGIAAGAAAVASFGTAQITRAAVREHWHGLRDSA
jgi:6-phosphofructokinase 2